MEKRQEGEKVGNQSLAISPKFFGRTIFLTGVWSVVALIPELVVKLELRILQ